EASHVYTRHTPRRYRKPAILADLLSAVRTAYYYPAARLSDPRAERHGDQLSGTQDHGLDTGPCRTAPHGPARQHAVSRRRGQDAPERRRACREDRQVRVLACAIDLYSAHDCILCRAA